MSYPEARRPLPPHTRGEYYIYIHLFTLFQSTDYYFPVFISTVSAEYPGGLEPEDHSCRTPLESNIQPQTVPQVRKCIPHWIRAAFWGLHWTDVTLEYLVGSYDSFLHAPLSGMRRQRGDTIFIFREKKISNQSSVYLTSKLCISVVSFISFIFVPCFPSTLERESRCDRACMIRSTKQQNGDVGRLEILQLSDLEIFPQAQDSF